jgi:S1-C subfamily serine protease
MKIRAWVLGLAVAAAVLPAAAPAQVEIRRQERVERLGSGWMGIQFQWDGEDAREARVRDVVDESPAERAGIRAGDVIVRINGQPATEEAVDRLREGLDEGESVRLAVRRDGREEERTVVAGKRPERVVIRGGPDIIGGGPDIIRFPEGSGERIIIRMDTMRAHMDSLLRHVDSLRVGLRRRGGDSVVIHVDTVVSILRDSLIRAFPRELPRVFGEGGMETFFYEFGPRSLAGAEFAEMNEGLGRYFRTSEGLLVLQVAPESPAARAGMEAGDVVVQADGQAVEELRDLREAFAKAEDRQVRLTVLRQGARRQIELKWEGRGFHRYRIEDRVRARGERGTEE